MMMALGLFVFSLSTLPYQELKRRRGWRFASNNRVGKKPARQYVGEDDETISLSGVLLPELTGGDMSLAVIEAMADQHTAWPLIEGTGHIYGMFTIDDIDTTRTLFFDDGIRCCRARTSAGTCSSTWSSPTVTSSCARTGSAHRWH
ncbi:hypothetical protein BDI4_60102 [Burkholderia diffusa]|uniref:phage tail protein n=1 Tax=Burkholderia diffusa TaxID=488732 RepID=UPI001CB09988|nr:phage tail protein [Burkholderia diffusa]CAG9259189.1 hypothetical protein BDI4_60102 [Burkholderia diffusa]